MERPLRSELKRAFASVGPSPFVGGQRPKSQKKKDLGFARKPMVGWFDPMQLIITAIRALLSIIFGAYADKREIQGSLDRPDLHDYSTEKELWFDYVADIGDGWNSTYTIAKLLSKARLVFNHKGKQVETQRGRFLIMGGDEVYPTPGRQAYSDRTVGPYQSALPWVIYEQAPHLYAIPGNHDWYDGLTSFTRLFCQKRWIGGWQTQQSRSYFAIKLPHNWWLWGVDTQLDAYIDKPQLNYFTDIAKKQMKRNDRIILCTAEPSWIYTVTKSPDAYHNIAYFERNVIRKHGGILSLNLTGDQHLYCRHQDESGTRQKIIAGGGGAFLHPPHRIPDALELDEGEFKVKYSRRAIFPSPATSRWLAFRNLLFSFKNWRLSRFLGSYYLLSAWIFQSSSSIYEVSLMQKLMQLTPRPGEIGEVIRTFYSVLIVSPLNMVLLLVLVFGMVAFCDAKRTFLKLSFGCLHGLTHVALNMGLIWLFAYLNLTIWQMTIGNPAHVLLFGAEMFVVGGLLGGFVMGIYLLVANLLLRFHSDTGFSSLSIADYKNFLRLHFNKKGDLTVYPVGVRKVCKKWRFVKEAEAGESWFEPVMDVQTHFIEDPVVIKKTAT